MRARKLKRLVQDCCPPVLWKLTARNLAAARARLGLRWLAPLLSLRIVTTLEGLDREIARADEAARTSDDALRQALAGFRYEPPFPLPADASSPEYAEAQRELYRHVSGRSSYDAPTCEMTDFPWEEILQRPFPYSTRSSTTVGEHLMAIGFLIRAMALQPGQRILEFGPGWGKTTVEMASMGHPITAVDINPRFLDLIRARAGRLGLDVTTICADMLHFRSDVRFDRVVFYECFHHCSDHVQMVRNLGELVSDDGMVLFAGEPIDDLFPQPWGLRLDGMSAWSIRKFGWLELGFRTDYFRDLLARHGWRTELAVSQDVSWQRVFIARRARPAGRG
jgi:SAM-dependent methyltransferase